MTTLLEAASTDDPGLLSDSEKLWNWAWDTTEEASETWKKFKGLNPDLPTSMKQIGKMIRFLPEILGRWARADQDNQELLRDLLETRRDSQRARVALEQLTQSWQNQTSFCDHNDKHTAAITDIVERIWDDGN